MPAPQPTRVFVDSDVIISSLIPKSGAAYTLLHDTSHIELYISNYSVLELRRVVGRLNISPEAFSKLIASRLNTIEVDLPYEKVQREFADYVRDPNDTHIVASAKESEAIFLVSYNIRHFVTEKIKEDFQVTLLTPGLFLQYLRSL
jgi:predicted nucleic acid-binding protein